MHPHSSGYLFQVVDMSRVIRLYRYPRQRFHTRLVPGTPSQYRTWCSGRVGQYRTRRSRRVGQYLTWRSR
eukprot:3545923-Rhodomonas_salina.1